jgi:branched-chain amino acid transport system ATP-binding protein
MLLEIAGLSSHYGRIQALREIALEVAAGELVALVGANGAGKTTLLGVISGVRPASAGTIRFDGRDVTRAPAAQRVRLGIAQAPEGRQIFDALSVEDNLRLGGYTRSSEESAETLLGIYGRFPMLAERRDKPAGTLSGGQQQMLALGRALMARPRMLLLDEPSMGLAPRYVEAIFATIETLKRAGTTILLVEQNAYAALAIADRGYVMETGRMVLAGTGAALRADDRVRAAYLGL